MPRLPRLPPPRPRQGPKPCLPPPSFRPPPLPPSFPHLPTTLPVSPTAPEPVSEFFPPILPRAPVPLPSTRHRGRGTVRSLPRPNAHHPTHPLPPDLCYGC